MTSLYQVSAWAAAGESDTQEFKRSSGQRREAARTLCAMLNHRGGRVLIGVDTSGHVAGQQVSDHSLEQVAAEVREIEPPVFPSIDRVDLATDRQVIVITVPPGANRPYTYRGEAYRRVGVAMYDDRLEVTSSGSLHFGFTPESLFEPHESRPWNPLIASVFYRRGLIESWGQGTLRMASWAKEAGMPLPEILEVPGAVVVRFYARKPTVTEKATGIATGKMTGKMTGKTPAGVLRLLAEDPSLTVPQLADLLKRSVPAIHRAIRRLRESGQLERVGPANGGYWRIIE